MLSLVVPCSSDQIYKTSKKGMFGIKEDVVDIPYDIVTSIYLSLLSALIYLAIIDAV